MNGLKSLLGSRKFWLMVAGLLVPVLNKKFGWDLTTEQVVTIILPVVALILGISIEDAGAKAKLGEAELRDLRAKIGK